mmetsp:Transcript_88065/g.284358  ORF Transcript_88065/g.284358 Transcript_88065/m.284358 type:complete len:108 (+) Transcript_88065:645-968(+)
MRIRDSCARSTTSGSSWEILYFHEFEGFVLRPQFKTFGRRCRYDARDEHGLWPHGLFSLSQLPFVDTGLDIHNVISCSCGQCQGRRASAAGRVAGPAFAAKLGSANQ